MGLVQTPKTVITSSTKNLDFWIPGVDWGSGPINPQGWLIGPLGPAYQPPLGTGWGRGRPQTWSERTWPALIEDH